MEEIIANVAKNTPSTLTSDIQALIQVGTGFHQSNNQSTIADHHNSTSSTRVHIYFTSSNVLNKKFPVSCNGVLAQCSERANTREPAKSQLFVVQFSSKGICQVGFFRNKSFETG
jgi:hypothetical protein